MLSSSPLGFAPPPPPPPLPGTHSGPREGAHWKVGAKGTRTYSSKKLRTSSFPHFGHGHSDHAVIELVYTSGGSGKVPGSIPAEDDPHL